MNSKKKVLITGSRGFVGRKLNEWMSGLGWEVVGFDQEDGDIARDVLSFSGLDHVFHLASKVYVPDSWDYTFDFYETNVMGTVNILELCRKNQCSLTYISSYVYGTPKYLPVDERHPIAPASPYNHSKLVAEDICRYYSQTFHVPVTVLRPVNIYGPGQRTDFLIPTIIGQVLDPGVKQVEVMDLRPRRDYLYIDDFMEVLVMTTQARGFDIFNIGRGYSVSVEELIVSVLKNSGIDKPYVAKNVERKNEVWDVYHDISKVCIQLGWMPKIGMDEGIRRCLEKEKQR